MPSSYLSRSSVKTIGEQLFGHARTTSQDIAGHGRGAGRIADLRRRVTLASTRPRPRHHLLGFDYGLLVRRGGTDAVASAGPPQSEAAGGDE